MYLVFITDDIVFKRKEKKAVHTYGLLKEVQRSCHRLLQLIFSFI